MINFVAFTAQHELEGTKFNGPWVCPTDRSDVADMFQGWEPEVQALFNVSGQAPIRTFLAELNCCSQCVDRPLRWAVHTVRPLRSFVNGRVALIGDAVGVPFLFLTTILMISGPGSCQRTSPGVWCCTGTRGVFKDC